MKRIILVSLVFLSMPSIGLAKDVIIQVSKQGTVDAGQVAGQNDKGDTIVVVEDDGKYEPTKAEKGSNEIIKVKDLDDKTIALLVEPETEDVTQEQIIQLATGDVIAWKAENEYKSYTDYTIVEEVEDTETATTLIKINYKYPQTVRARKWKINIDLITEEVITKKELLNALEEKTPLFN